MGRGLVPCLTHFQPMFYLWTDQIVEGWQGDILSKGAHYRPVTYIFTQNVTLIQVFFHIFCLQKPTIWSLHKWNIGLKWVKKQISMRQHYEVTFTYKNCYSINKSFFGNVSVSNTCFREINAFFNLRFKITFMTSENYSYGTSK